MSQEITIDQIRKMYQLGRQKQAGPNSYEVSRQLDEVYADSEFWGTYRDLPSYKGQDVEQLVEQLSHQPDPRILDVGCGKGYFLQALHDEYGSIFQLDGLTMRDYRTQEDLEEDSPVNIEIGDIVTFHRPETYDLAVAMQSLDYTINPLVALKRMYAALKPEGIALAFPLTLRFETERETQAFKDYLFTHYGFMFSEGNYGFTQLAFKKRGHGSLTMPVSLVSMKITGNEYDKNLSAIYRFTGPT